MGFEGASKEDILKALDAGEIVRGAGKTEHHELPNSDSYSFDTKEEKLTYQFQDGFILYGDFAGEAIKNATLLDFSNRPVTDKENIRVRIKDAETNLSAYFSRPNTSH